jgi:hypothetical protein
MHNTIPRPPIAAVISLAAAITLMVGATAPPATTLHAAPAPRLTTQAVALVANPLAQIWDVGTGADTSHPLPVGANPIAPVTEQVIRSVATYGGQLLTGQGQLIPGEISAQVKNVQNALPAVQSLLVEDVAVIPAVALGAFFLTATVIGSLPASASDLPALADIWLRAALLPPLKWVYNGFAIRNAIAVALQPPSSAPEPVTAATTASTKPIQRQASSGHTNTTNATASAKRVTPPTSKRSAKPAAASSTTTRAKSGVAGAQRQPQAAP